MAEAQSELLPHVAVAGAVQGSTGVSFGPSPQSANFSPEPTADWAHFEEHYSAGERQPREPFTRYKRRDTTIARDFCARHGLPDYYKDFDTDAEHKEGCTPWCCHNKKRHARARPKDTIIFDKPHGISKVRVCHNKVVRVGGANCASCITEKKIPSEKKKAPTSTPLLMDTATDTLPPASSSSGSHSFPPRALTSYQLPPQVALPLAHALPRAPPPSAVASSTNGGYYVHSAVLCRSQEAIAILFDFMTGVLPWRQRCKTSERDWSNFPHNPHFDHTSNARFDSKWSNPAPTVKTSRVQRLQKEFELLWKQLKRGKRASEWVHPASNTVPTAQRFFARIPPRMLRQMREEMQGGEVTCDLTCVLPEDVRRSIDYLIGVAELAVGRGSPLEYECDMAELMGNHPWAVRQVCHTETVSLVRRVSCIMGIRESGAGAYRSTCIYTRRPYVYSEGAMKDLQGAMEHDWDTGYPEMGDGMIRVELDECAVFEFMADLLHAGPGNASPGWRFLLFMSWPLSGAEEDPDALVGTFQHWKNHYAANPSH